MSMGIGDIVYLKHGLYGQKVRVKLEDFTTEDNGERCFVVLIGMYGREWLTDVMESELTAIKGDK